MIRSVTKHEVLLVTYTTGSGRDNDQIQESKAIIAMSEHTMVGFVLHIPPYQRDTGIDSELASFAAHLETP